jgi:DNA invertase Pin-like site-specific DNA recombinase
MRVAIYCRVSTDKQTTENQLIPLRQFVEARKFTLFGEYVDHGISGAKDSRPELNKLLSDAKKRKFDILICWKLDRVARSLKHLITIMSDLNALGIQFISLTENVDTTIPSGKLLFSILGALSEFERDLIRERINAGLQRARNQGKVLGRPRLQVDIENLKSLVAQSNSIRQIAKITGLSRQTINRILMAQNRIENGG